MEKKRQAQYVDHGFGFPIVLEGIELVKVRGHWTPNVNYNELAKQVLLELAQLRGRLTGDQIRFIRHYFEMTLGKFAERCNVTHPAVLKWERAGPKPTGMNWCTEKDIRLFITTELEGTGKALLALYHRLETATPARAAKVKVDAQKLAA